MSDGMASLVAKLRADGWWQCARISCLAMNRPTARMCQTCGLSGQWHTPTDQKAPSGAFKPKRKGDRRLRTHRKANAAEAEFGHMLERRKQAGEIEYYGFEEITLRWADMEYTPDYFVIVGSGYTGFMIEALYVEIKGAHKFEDSIIKFKAARDRFKWARFELWQKVDGRWEKTA